MPETREATCRCGQLRIRCQGDPDRISICHCFECQKRTGSVFGVQAWFTSERTQITGTSSCFDYTGDDGGQARFHFCAACGATVYYRGDWRPDSVGVPVGAFADPSFPAPTVSLYESRCHKWAEMPALAAEPHR